MKTFAPPCGLLALSFLAFSYLIAIPVKAQTIQIDSTFNSNGEIFPFENFDLISSLTIEGDIHYLETTTAPQFSEPSEYFSSDGNNKTKQPKENYIKLFPNPAGDYVIVYYDIVSDSQPIFLELTDNQGIITRSILLDSGTNQVIVNLENLPNGIYLFNLYLNGNKLESHKLIKVRN